MFDEFLSYFSRLTRVEARFHEAIKKDKIDISKMKEECVVDIMFEIFQKWPQLNGDDFCSDLEKNFTLTIPSHLSFLKAIESNQNETDFDKYKPIGMQVLKAEMP